MFSRGNTQWMIPALVILLALAAVSAIGDQGGLDLRFSSGEVKVTVHGKVTDKATGNPIPNALVRGHIVIWQHQGPDLFDQCPYQEVHADAAGRYQLDFTTPLTTSGPMKGQDNACVYVSAPGYESVPQYVKPRVTVDHTDFADVDFKLDPGLCVKGQVVDADRKPVPDAVVRVQSNLNGDWNHFGAFGKGRTDAQGQFEVWTVRDFSAGELGIPRLLVSTEAHGAYQFRGFSEKPDMGVLVLPRGGDIEGRVVDIQGNPVPNCEVSAFTEMTSHRTATDAGGRYVFHGMLGRPSLLDIFETKKLGKQAEEFLTKTTLYARANVATPLNQAAQCVLVVKEGEANAAPDLVLGSEASVSGKLVSANPALPLAGMMVRCDSWDNMVEADADGMFAFPVIAAGKHQLSAYLSSNLRGDRGIGRTEIEVKPGVKLENVEITLDGLTEIHLRFRDINDQPLEGITPGATWSRNGDGFWTEGTRSDVNGSAVLYLQPGGIQYVRGFDMNTRDLVAETCIPVVPRENAVMDDLEIRMVPGVLFHARAVKENGEALGETPLECRLLYADGTEYPMQFKTDAMGALASERKLPPGIVRASFDTTPAQYTGALPAPVEIKPGETKDLGDIAFQSVKFYKVSGRLQPSPTLQNLEGLKIRLDLEQWEPMIPTDAEGRFVLDKVPAGKHRLIAYLPFNLRTDMGVGHVEIEVKDQDLPDVMLPLDTLATVHMRITDESGMPLEGVSAAAWWSEDHSGVFTEGTKSGKDGAATLYLYPGGQQYIGAHDWDKRYTLKQHQILTPKAGDVTDNFHVIMLRDGQDSAK